jgi:hypothetical protein
MPTFAVTNGNHVENIIVADDKHECETALNCTLVEITDDQPLGIGWWFDGTTWQPPETETPDA